MNTRRPQQGEVLLSYADEEEVIHQELVMGAGDPVLSRQLVEVLTELSRQVIRGGRSDLTISLLRAAVEAADAGAAEPSDAVTDGEASVLAGYRTATEADVLAAVQASVEARRRLLSNSLTTRQAASLLGVNPSRVRQRLDDGSVWGFKQDGEWRIPAWQFADGQSLPGITTVNRAFAPDLDPTVVEGFLFTPSPDLRLHEGEVSPIEWLAARQDPEPVARIAASL